MSSPRFRLTRRKSVLALTCVCCLAALGLAAHTFNAESTDEDGAGWALDDLRTVRGPRDLWSFLNGDMARRRRQYFILIQSYEANVEEWVHLLQAKKQNDWPMFGGTPQRNMANTTARNIPADWSVEEGKLRNIKWSAELGTRSYGAPVIADGKVFVGTNNGKPRDPAIKGTKAALMCFNEADGKFLWQAVHEVPLSDLNCMTARYGLWSTPCVQGGRHYYVTPNCKVICAENDTGKAVWHFDLMEKLKVAPTNFGDCSPLIVDDLVMIVTGNGADEDGKVVSPTAPSFVALDKNTGKLAWQSSLPGDKIIAGQWSNPTIAVVGGKKQVLFPGGDCWLYSFEPATGELIWKCNCNPERGTPKADNKFNPYFVATPVVHEGRCYIGMGVYPGFHPAPPRYSYLLCLDMAGKGDVSPRSLAAREPDNAGSALLWSFGGPVEPRPKKGRKARFGATVSTCAIHDGLLYIAEENGYVYCLDAQTGQRQWVDDVEASIWGSPFYADGKVFLGTDDGEVIVYQHGKDLKVLAKIDMGERIHSTPVVANGVLYVATWSKLYAIAAAK
jgi:outer membrane protein assembly factor BamB